MKMFLDPCVPTARFLVAAAVVFGLLLSGCSKDENDHPPRIQDPREAAGTVRIGGTYRIPLVQTPTTLDPVHVQDWYGESIVHQVFDGLVRFGPYLNILPALAESWQVEEQGLLYRFFLQGDARFHSGRPVTARDVVFTVRRLLRSDPSTSILPHLLKIEGADAFRKGEKEDVAGLAAHGDVIVEMRLTEPDAPFLSALAMYQAVIVPAESVQQQANGFGRHPIGSGPFYFSEWDATGEIRLRRFNDYFAGPAFLDEILFRIYPGGRMDQVLFDFKNGELEEMPVYGGIRQELSGERKYLWLRRPSLSLLFYGIKVDHPLLKDVDLRMALSLAIDRENLVSQVYNRQFEPAGSILPPGMPAYSRETPIAVHDEAKAAALLKKIMRGRTGPLPTIEIASGSSSAFARHELEFVRNCWRRIGLTAETKFITEWPEFEKYLKSDQVQIYRYAWNADLPDPDSFLSPLFASDSPVNFTRFDDGSIDQMLIRARSTIDPVERAEIYRQIEKGVLQKWPVIPLFYLSIDRVYQATVQGVHLNALGAHTMSLHRVWLKDDNAAD